MLSVYQAVLVWFVQSYLAIFAIDAIIVLTFFVRVYCLLGTEFPVLVRSPTNDGCGGMNLNKVTVLSKDEWEGMQYRLNKRQIEAEKIRKAQEEKQRLHELSVERAKNWSNTIYVREEQFYSKLVFLWKAQLYTARSHARVT